VALIERSAMMMTISLHDGRSACVLVFTRATKVVVALYVVENKCSVVGQCKRTKRGDCVDEVFRKVASPTVGWNAILYANAPRMAWCASASKPASSSLG
jgi:hypothetical protein